MELSKINSKLYGERVTVGADAPVSTESREKWLVKNFGLAQAEAHDTVHDLMTQAICDGAMAWWREEIPDDMDLVTWIDIHYYTLLFDFMEGGDLL